MAFSVAFFLRTTFFFAAVFLTAFRSRFLAGFFPVLATVFLSVGVVFLVDFAGSSSREVPVKKVRDKLARGAAAERRTKSETGDLNAILGRRRACKTENMLGYLCSR